MSVALAHCLPPSHLPVVRGHFGHRPRRPLQRRVRGDLHAQVSVPYLPPSLLGLPYPRFLAPYGQHNHNRLSEPVPHPRRSLDQTVEEALPSLGRRPERPPEDVEHRLCGDDRVDAIGGRDALPAALAGRWRHQRYPDIHRVPPARAGDGEYLLQLPLNTII